MNPKMKSAIEKITLNDATFSNEVIEPTYVNFFYGKNGAGKSTIARAFKANDEHLQWQAGRVSADYDVVKVKDDTDLSTFKTIHCGDYCISLRSFQGGFEYSEYEGVVSPAYQVFYAIKPICDRFYKYLFKAGCFINEMNSHTMSLRDGKNIAFDDFGNTYIPYPPIEEQIAVADYLDKQAKKIDKLSIELQKQLDSLDRYKQSLVFECVTGKKEMR